MDPATPGQYGGYQPPPPSGGGGYQAAQAKVGGPAIGLMVVAGIGIVVQILNILVNLLGIRMASSDMEDNPMAGLIAGPIVVVAGSLGILMGILILVGAMKMKKLESYGLAMAVTILAMIPCISPCCLLGLPIGIWSLVVLLDPNVKASFR